MGEHTERSTLTRDQIIQNICIQAGYFPPTIQIMEMMRAAYEAGYGDALEYVNDQIDIMIRRYKHD